MKEDDAFTVIGKFIGDLVGDYFRWLKSSHERQKSIEAERVHEIAQIEKLKKCECGKFVSAHSKFCPHCGKENKE